MIKNIYRISKENSIPLSLPLNFEYKNHFLNIINQDTLMNDENRTLFLINYIFYTLKSFNSYYPNFDFWLKEKILKGIYNGTRQIIIKWSDSEIIGLSIIKNDISEKKICCLRVMPNYIHSGFGVRLFIDSMNILEENKPLLSVNENNLLQFKKIFSYFDYKKCNTYPNLYRKGITEISFNGSLK